MTPPEAAPAAEPIAAAAAGEGAEGSDAEVAEGAEGAEGETTEVAEGAEGAEGETTEVAGGDPAQPGRKRRRRGRGGANTGTSSNANANASGPGSGQRDAGPRGGRDPREGVGLELARLVELATKYPEIGPPLAELAYKIDHAEVGDQIVRMGLQGGGLGLEYHLVAVNVARREGRYADALGRVGEAAKAFASRPTDVAAHVAGDEARLLQLVRIGFNVILFDAKDMSAAPVLAGPLAEVLPKLEPMLGADPLFHVLLAQTLWFTDRTRAEAAWETACNRPESEHAWNARGTWAKEAEKDGMRAEGIYRRGLDVAPQSALLHHNLAQTLLDRAEAPDVDVEAARRLLREVDEHLRFALREEGPRGLRRHVHATRDRLFALRNKLGGGGGRPQGQHQGGQHQGGQHQGHGQPRPPRHVPEPEPAREVHPGDVINGRICSVAPYGAFVALGGGMVGMVHKSELAHGPVGDVAQLLKIGDELEVKVLEINPQPGGRPRIALSRRALLPVPAGFVERGNDRGHDRGNDRGPRDQRGGGGGPRGGGGGGGGGGDRRPDRGGGGGARARDQHPAPTGPPAGKFLAAGKVSLGELLLAKLKEQERK